MMFYAETLSQLETRTFPKSIHVILFAFTLFVVLISLVVHKVFDKCCFLHGSNCVGQDGSCTSWKCAV